MTRLVRTVFRRAISLGDVITMDERLGNGKSRQVTLRDRRYAIRYPFAADVELLDLESGARGDGVTSDVSLGGCFVCTSKPLPLHARVRITLKRKDQIVEALGVVRIVKARIGMGVEFLDLETTHGDVLNHWIEQLRRAR